MRLRKRGIKIEQFLEMLGDNYGSRNAFLTGLPQPRTSGDLEVLSKWFFGKSFKHTMSCGMFGPFKYRKGDSIISKSSAKRMMKEEMAKGKGIGHITVNLSHTEIEWDSEFNEEVKKRIEKRIGLDTKRYALDISSSVAKNAFFGSIFGSKQGGVCNGTTCYNSTYYFEDIKQGEIIESWSKLANAYESLRKSKERNRSYGQRYMPWNHNGNDEPRLKFTKEELYKTSPEFMKEFNRLKNLSILIK